MTEVTRIDADAAFATVDQLRELLAGVPGNAQVSIDALPEGVRFDTLVLLAAIDGGDLRPERVLPSALHRVTRVSICEASGVLGEDRPSRSENDVPSGQVFKIDPNDPESFGTMNPGIEALKKLDARQVAMLDRQELELLREFMDHGRRQGVLVEFDTDTDVQGWAEMNAVHALEILAVANSYIRLRFL